MHLSTHAAECQKLLPASAKSNVDIRIPRGAAMGMQAVKKFGLSPAAAASHIAALAQLTAPTGNHQVASSAAADPREPATSAWGSTVLQAAEEELGRFVEQVQNLSSVGAASHAMSAKGMLNNCEFGPTLCRLCFALHTLLAQSSSARLSSALCFICILGMLRALGCGSWRSCLTVSIIISRYISCQCRLVMPAWRLSKRGDTA